VLSAQCLSEFFVVVTGRLPDRMPPARALEQVERLAGACEVVAVTSAVTQEACRGAIRHALSLWDALIWAAAKLAQVPIVLTEDAPHGRVIEGVQYQDPFDARFRIASLRDG
jgi:predicted nucleic acid-binding protein